MLPFKYHVATDGGETLNTIARRHDISVDDLRQWNTDLFPPSSPAPNSEGTIVPKGTFVQLPPVLHYRGNVYGTSFNVDAYSRRLHETIAAQNALLAGLLPPPPHPCATSSAAAASSSALFIPPHRRVLSKQELARELMAAEAVAQCPAGDKEEGSAANNATARQPPRRTSAYVAHLLEGAEFGTLEARLKAAEGCFDKCPRAALAAKNAEVMRAVAARRKPNHLSDDRVQTTKDPSDRPIEAGKDLRLVFSFYDLRSLYVVKETWAVLASQNIGVLIDAIRCKTTLLSYHNTPNSFFFIGGTFYVDDRHEGWADMTVELREWDPVRSIVDRAGRDAIDPRVLGLKRAYGVCPVKYVSQTTFGDLTVRPNELCVFRHCANCDHIFFLSGAGVVPATDALSTDASAFITNKTAAERITHVSQFPRRLYLAPERSITCDVCSKLPANIATYGDSIAPFNPALFCLPCFRISHCDREGNEVNDGYVKLELPEGEFF